MTDSLSPHLYVTSLHNLNHSDKHDLGVPQWREQVEQDIDYALQAGVNIRETVVARSHAIDSLLIALFNYFELDKTSLALIAVGGYGRAEMLPFSDVDILLLSQTPLTDHEKTRVELFIARLWDVGLDPGVSVRSVAECVEAATDITVATSLTEARLLCGNTALSEAPKYAIGENWSDNGFYHAKVDEQQHRYQKHNFTEYNLEPDIKNAPGGLRDINHIGWITKRHFRVNRLYDLVHLDFLTDKEYKDLIQAEGFLWLIRHHLHRLTGRNENRLLFDHQHDIAAALGYKQDEHKNAAVEALMRDYYQSAMQISTLTEMLAAYYYESIIEARLPDKQKPKKQKINAHFKLIGEQIAVTNTRVFFHAPSSILELFLLMGQYNVKRIRARTLRLLKLASPRIDTDYRNQAENQQLFLANVKEQNLLFHRLRMMKRYGVLSHYLPAFGKVMGLMQYDLFHRYTVDAHTLLLVRILHRFTDPKYRDQFPVVAPIYQKIERKELLVLAAIFHDIAKGRGGDHSELGATDAYDFCIAHNLSIADANLVAWLTKHHLVMSMTSQKQDISDPEVVRYFAETVVNMTQLNYLYVLTTADMNATNPQLWNSWRATLMKQLYSQTRRMLRADLNTPLNKQAMITETRQKARNLLAADKDRQAIEAIWEDLDDEYFLRETPTDIVWHTRAILKHGDNHNPLIILREHRELALDAVQVFIYTQDKSNLFAATITVFDKLNLDVLDARVITATRDFALDSYVLLDRHGTLLRDNERQQQLISELNHAIAHPEMPKLVNRRVPRQLKHFDVPTKITFKLNAELNQHQLFLETLDRPGLLARVGLVFLQHEIEIHYARITTLGERAEDVFYISDHQDQPLSQAKLSGLKRALEKALSLEDNE